MRSSHRAPPCSGGVELQQHVHGVAVPIPWRNASSDNADTAPRADVFSIDELLRAILSYSEPAVLAYVATVSKSFSHVALDILWFSLPGLHPFLTLMKVLAGEDGDLETCKIKTREARFISYASRVRKVSQVDPNIDPLLAALPIDLPNLQAVSWFARSTVLLEPMKSILSRAEGSITDVKISWNQFAISPLVYQFMEAVQNSMCAARITSFSLSYLPGFRKSTDWLHVTPQILQAVPRVLQSLTALSKVALTCNVLCFPLLKTLSEMAFLTSLTLSWYFPFHRHLLECLNPGPGMFRHLRELTLDCSIASANVIMRCITSVHMTTLDICTQVLDGTTAFVEMFKIIGGWLNLRELHISVSHGQTCFSSSLNPQLHKVLQDNGHVHYSVPMSSWLELVHCRELRILNFSSICPVEMDNDTLSKLVLCWKHIESLVLTPLPISVCCLRSRKRVTIDSLVYIAEACPKILSLALDVRVVIENWMLVLGYINGPFESKLQHLEVGGSQWNEDPGFGPGCLGATLKAVFPRLQPITWDNQSDLPVGRLEKSVEHSRDSWQVVADSMENGYACDQPECLVCPKCQPPNQGRVVQSSNCINPNLLSIHERDREDDPDSCAVYGM